MGEALSLEGARVLVVGASAGIGRQISLAAARAGAAVAFAARRKDRLDDLVHATGSGHARLNTNGVLLFT